MFIFIINITINQKKACLTMKQLCSEELLEVNGGDLQEDIWHGIGYTIAKKQYEASCLGGKMIPNPNGTYPATICIKNQEGILFHLINISDNELNEINGGVVWIPLAIKIATGVGAGIGVVSGVNAIGSAYESAKKGYESFTP